MPGVDTALLDEAVHWLTRKYASDFSAAEEAELQRWRKRSAAHERVWQCAEQLRSQMGTVPASIGMAVLARTRRRPDRRQVLRAAGLALVTPALGWLAYRNLPWQAWTADYRTATGERRSVTLADGSRIVLNTASALSARFDRETRLVRHYSGEILVETAHAGAPAALPFIVETDNGRMRALGTRFIVRVHGLDTTLSVLEGAVEITPRRSARSMVVRAGEQTRFDDTAFDPVRRLAEDADAWSQGVLYAHGMRLEDFLAELARYRPGVLQCDPGVADLRVSGAFHLDDTDRVLDLLARTLPVQVETRTRFWTRIARR